MNPFRETPRDVLKRMLANGPLAAVPKRPADQQLLVALAAAQFEPGKTYAEAEVNETLERWMSTFCEPDGIDHVTLRRMLVDSRLLMRTRSGSAYRLSGKRAETEALEAVEPAGVLAEVRSERESRKRGHACLS